MARLGQDAPSLRKQFGDVAVHPLHAEEPLAVIDSIPALLVCERLDLHRSLLDEWTSASNIGDGF